MLRRSRFFNPNIVTQRSVGADTTNGVSGARVHSQLNHISNDAAQRATHHRRLHREHEEDRRPRAGRTDPRRGQALLDAEARRPPSRRTAIRQGRSYVHEKCYLCGERNTVCPILTLFHDHSFFRLFPAVMPLRPSYRTTAATSPTAAPSRRSRASTSPSTIRPRTTQTTWNCATGSVRFSRG